MQIIDSIMVIETQNVRKRDEMRREGRSERERERKLCVEKHTDANNEEKKNVCQ